jgi:replication initiation protein RepC
MAAAAFLAPPDGGRGRDASIAGQRSRMDGSKSREGEPASASAGQTLGKVEIFNALRTAARSMGLNKTDLALLWALINFRPEQIIPPDADGRAIVFPSNATLRARLNVEADSTISRAMAKLEAAGLVRRHMSPNRKRYRVRDAGDGGLAFGIDIMPFWASRHDILVAARAAADRTADRRVAIARLRGAIARASAAEGDCAGIGAVIQEARCMLRRRRIGTADLQEAATRIDSLCVSLLPSNSHDSVMQSARHTEDSKTEDRPAAAPDPVTLERAFPTVTRLIRDVAAAHPRDPLHEVTELVALGLGLPRASWKAAVRTVGPLPALACLGRLAEQPDVARPWAYFGTLVRSVDSGRTTLQDLVRRRSPASCAPPQAHGSVRQYRTMENEPVEARPH